jgi:hypothetical protein
MVFITLSQLKQREEEQDETNFVAVIVFVARRSSESASIQEFINHSSPCDDGAYNKT